jgi:hypothetical protein
MHNKSYDFMQSIIKQKMREFIQPVIRNTVCCTVYGKRMGHKQLYFFIMLVYLQLDTRLGWFVRKTVSKKDVVFMHGKTFTPPFRLSGLNCLLFLFLFSLNRQKLNPDPYSQMVKKNMFRKFRKIGHDVMNLKRYYSWIFCYLKNFSLVTSPWLRH